jgi:hypothetical protein
MKKWKTQIDRNLRRNDDEMPSGMFYKKTNDIWGSPSDGK